MPLSARFLPSGASTRPSQSSSFGASASHDCGLGCPAPKQRGGCGGLGVASSVGQKVRLPLGSLYASPAEGEHTHTPRVAAHSPTFESVQVVIAPAPTSGWPLASGLPSSVRPSQSSSMPLQTSIAHGWIAALVSSQSAPLL